MKKTIKTISLIAFTLFSIHAFAEDKIKIIVKTDEKSAAAIGYTVGGQDSGGAGKFYRNEGPRNKTYTFGYRKDSTNGKDITCCRLNLTRNTIITLKTSGNKCRCVRG